VEANIENTEAPVEVETVVVVDNHVEVVEGEVIEEQKNEDVV
jgi:hypothetical protein